MRRAPRWAAMALTVAAATTMTAGQALARPAPGWRIEKVFSGGGYLDLQAIASSGAGNAWLLALVPAPQPTFVTQRWNGHRWVPVALPARLRNVIGPWALFSGIYTTSPGDTWFFPDLPGRSGMVQYAVRRNGSAWTVSKVTTSPDTVLGAAVFSARDVWAFGQARPSFPRYSAAVVRRWNGTRWQTETVPVGTPVAIDGVSPHDIWALGVSKATIGSARQVMVVMHWNGAVWSVPRLPAIPPVRAGSPWVATAIWAAGPRDAWVTETPAVSQQTGTGPAGLVLLHWNGSAWAKIASSHTLSGASGLTPDGHGGFWFTAADPANPRATDIIDYRHGTFTSQPAPAPPGYADSVSGITAIPGTGSLWATAALLASVTTGTSKTAILRYDP